MQATDYTVDELLRALAHPDRRRLLRELRDRQRVDSRTSLSLSALKDTLDVSDERATIVLHHRHLPVLREGEVIEQSGQTDGGTDSTALDDESAVAPGPRFDQAVAVLEALPGTDQRPR